MDPVEKAIRNALDRADASDPSFRDKVYRSAFAALERTVAARPELTVESVIRRRKHLQATIDRIESEFAPAVEAVPPDLAASPSPEVAPVVAHEPIVNRARVTQPPPVAEARPVPPPAAAYPPNPSPRPEPQHAPEVDLDALLTEDDLALDDDEDGLAVEPVAPVRRAAPELEVTAGKRRAPLPPRRRRGRWRTYLAGVVILILAVGAAVWWLLADTNALGVSRLSPVARKVASPIGGAAADKGWITIFTPDDPTQAVAAGGAEAKVAKQGNETVLKISSPDGETPVAFKVGPGVLEQLAGRNAVFDIVARAENGQKTQVSVSCDFGALGDCGRSRFEIGGTTSDHLLRVTLKDAAPDGEGTIFVVPDVTGSGKVLEILRIRASVENAGSG